jgi:hypothetical protein
MECHLSVDGELDVTRKGLKSTHKNTGAAFGRWAFATEAFDLTIGIDLVVLQDRHLNLLAFMLRFLDGLNEQI